MKKVCAVLFVLLLALASFAQDHDDNVVRSKKIAGNITVDRNVGDLQVVAEFEQQVVGVAVSASGRVFVSFPRNGIDTVKNSVEEVIENKAVASDPPTTVFGFPSLAHIRTCILFVVPGQLSTFCRTAARKLCDAPTAN